MGQKCFKKYIFKKIPPQMKWTILAFKKFLLQIFSNTVKMIRELQSELKLITSTSLECAQIPLPTQL